MTHHLDPERNRKADRQGQALTAQRQAIFERAFRRAMDNEDTRAVLNAFFQEVGLDGSPFHPHGSHQSHMIGMQDAAKWWVNAIRAHCPEREPQLRIEARNAALAIATEEKQNDG